MASQLVVNNQRLLIYKNQTYRARKLLNCRRQGPSINKAFIAKNQTTKSSQEQANEKWLLNLRDLILSMVQDTITYEQQSTASNFESEIEEEKIEYVDHINFELVVILSKLFNFKNDKLGQFDEWLYTFGQCFSLSIVNMLFNTNSLDKAIKKDSNKNQTNFLRVYETCKTSGVREYILKATKIFIQFKTLQELPERFKKNPAFYQRYVQELNRLMYSNPVPYLQQFFSYNTGDIIQMAIYSLFLGIGFYFRQENLQLIAVGSLKLVYFDCKNTNQIFRLVIMLIVANRLCGLHKINSYSTSKDDFETYLVAAGKSFFLDCYCNYLEASFSQDNVEAVTHVLKILFIHKNKLQSQFYQVNYFDDGVVLYEADPALGAYQQKNGENQVENLQFDEKIEYSSGKLQFVGDSFWEYAAHTPKQIPGTRLTWVTHNESVLSSLGTPLLNVAMMMLRLTALFVQKEAQLTKQQIQRCFQQAYSFTTDDFDVDDELFGQKEPVNVENFRKELLDWVYDQFYQLGGMSLLIALRNYRTQRFGRQQMFSIDDLQEFLSEEQNFLKEEGGDDFYKHFLGMILEEEYYGEEIREEVLRRRFRIVEAVDKWLSWLEDFQHVHSNFLFVQSQLPKVWDDATEDQICELIQAAVSLTMVWVEQPAGLPFVKELLQGVPEAIFLANNYSNAQFQKDVSNHSAALIQVKMMCDELGLRDINSDMLCMLAQQNVITCKAIQPLAEFAENKLQQMSVASPFTNCFLEILLFYYVENMSLEKAVEVLKKQEWQQQLAFLYVFTGRLKLQMCDEEKSQYLSSHMELLLEVCERSLLLKCKTIEDQQIVVCTTLQLSQFFTQMQWEILFCKVVQNFGDLHPVTGEMILKFAPDKVLDSALKSELNLSVFKLVLCKLIIFNQNQSLELKDTEIICKEGVLQQYYIKDYLSENVLKYSDKSDTEILQYNYVFKGDVVDRGINLELFEEQAIKILLQMMSVYYEDSPQRFKLLSEIIASINKKNFFTEEMFHIIYNYLCEWQLKQDQVLHFLIHQKNANSKIGDGVLERSLIACLQSPEYHTHAYDAIDNLDNNRPAQTRILAALFDLVEKIELLSKNELLFRWLRKLQDVIPGACVKSQNLLSFLSNQDEALGWITSYGTSTEINQIICSSLCGMQLTLQLIQYSLKNQILDKKSCEYLLHEQIVSQDLLMELLLYVSDRNFRVSGDTFQNICKRINTEDMHVLDDLNESLVNNLIFAAYQIQDHDQTLLIVEYVLQNQPSKFILDWRGLTSYIIALKQHNFENNKIFSKVQQFLQQKMFLSDEGIVEIRYIDIIAVINILIDQQSNLYLQIFENIANTPLDQEIKVQILLPRIEFCLDNFGSSQQRNTELLNKIFHLSVQANYPSQQIYQALLQVLQTCPSYKFQNQTIFAFVKQLMNENQFQGINKMFEPTCFLNLQQSIEQIQWIELFDILCEKLQHSNFVQSDDVKNFLLLFFNFQGDGVGDYLVQFCILLASNSWENIEFVLKLFNETFDGNITNYKQFVQFLDKLAEVQPPLKLPESLLSLLDENIEILTLQIRSAATLSYCVIITQDQSGQICLRCYDALHSKHKHKINPQVWKSALLNATRLQQYEKGYEILRHIPQERRIKEKEWELDDPKSQSAEIILEINGGQDLEKGWKLITQLWNDSAVLPQKEIQIILEFLAEQQNPHTCAIMVNKIFECLKPCFLTAQFDLSFLVAFTSALTSSDQSINKEEAVIHVLLSFLNNQNCDNERQLQNFLGSCLLLNPQLLPVVVVVCLSCKIDISSDILDILEEDEMYQDYLNDCFGCSSILELMLEKSMEELQQAARKQEVTRYTQKYLTDLWNEHKGDIKSMDDDILPQEWRGYEKSAWLSVLVQDGNWKQWSQDKLLACAQKIKGSKLKQYKQKREIISIIEKEYDNILLRQ